MKTLLTGKLRLRAAAVLLICLTAAVWLPGGTAAAANNDATEADTKIVYMIDLQGNYTGSTVGYVRRALFAAANDRADYLLVKMNAGGSFNVGMKEISDMLLASPVYSICYVEGTAYDGAALVALSCDTVVMSSGSCFGSEDKLSNKDFRQDKPREYWRQVFEDVAVATGRSINAARNLTDMQNFGIYLNQSSNIYQVSADAAISVGLANYQATSLHVIFDDYGLSNGVIIQVEKNIIERFVDVLAEPAVSTLLLLFILGALLVLELTHGYRLVVVPGIICGGVLYFVGIYELGTASAALFLLPAALVLILLEVLLSPGLWICGCLGFLSMICSVVFFADTWILAAMQIILILIVAVILIMTKTNNEKSRNILKKLVLRDRTTTEGGYLSQPINIRDYLGMEGVALTALRPAGAVKIGSERVDVVTEGDFISAGDRVKVIKVDGSSVIVRKL